jgi:hypothetical protein
VRTETKRTEWTKKEDELLIEGMDEYQGNWRKMSKIVNSNKAASECLKRSKQMDKGK